MLERRDWFGYLQRIPATAVVQEGSEEEGIGIGIGCPGAKNMALL
jgi:hypothetical protein